MLAASGNRGAGAAQALNAGLGISNYYSQQQRQNAQNDLLRQKLEDVFKATAPMSSSSTVASMPVNPSTVEFSMPDAQPPRSAPSAVPLEKQTTISQQPVFSPQAQKLGEALAAATRKGARLRESGNGLLRPHFRSAAADRIGERSRET